MYSREENLIKKLSSMSEEEILNSIPVLIYNAYELGFLRSKKYSINELDKKKKELLKLEPIVVSYTRWKYEIEKYFNYPDFKDCPDKYLFLLDNFFQKGTPL